MLGEGKTVAVVPARGGPCHPGKKNLFHTVLTRCLDNEKPVTATSPGSCCPIFVVVLFFIFHEQNLLEVLFCIYSPEVPLNFIHCWLLSRALQ